MKDTEKNKIKSDNLRKRAEALLQKTPSTIQKMPNGDIRDMKTLVEELQVYQIELEMQGDELRRSQQELEEARDRYLDLYDFAPVGYVTLSENGTILRSNLALATLLGVGKSRLPGMPFPRFIAEDDRDIFYFHTKKLLETRDRDTCELRLVKKDGRQFYVKLDSITVESRTGNMNEFRISISDIHEQKELEAQLHQAQKMEAIGTLAGGIAHDFNNILAIILGNAELASDDVPDSNPASGSLKEIRLASIRAKDMVKQLLAFSRKSDEARKPLSLAPIIKESMKMLRTAIPTSVAFKQVIPDDPCNIWGDAAQINQILMNMVTNAAHAMSKEGGRLEITLEKFMLQEEKTCFDWVLPPGPYVRLSVRDTGEGIAPETMTRIFEPYFTTKDVGKGTGMGLSVAHGIVKRHGGGIRVESVLGEGTVFEIYFPALEKTVVKEKEPDGKIKGGSERILFVDDEASMVNLNHQRLERLGYQVKSTTNPLEALEWFKADPDQFDLVITDMTMPGMTGDGLTREILAIRPEMRVIVCTGYSERMSEKEAAALGARKYLEKPIDARKLAAVLREVLDRK